MPYAGVEHISKTYEVLASHDSLFWKSISAGELPENALKTGNAGDETLYSVKTNYFGRTSIGKYSIHNGTAYFAFHRKERELKAGDIQILCYEKYGENVSSCHRFELHTVNLKFIPSRQRQFLTSISPLYSPSGFLLSLSF